MVTGRGPHPLTVSGMCLIVSQGRFSGSFEALFGGAQQPKPLLSKAYQTEWHLCLPDR